MNTILSGIIIGCVIVAIAFWLCIFINAISDAKISLYKENEERSKNNKYIEKAEDKKDKKLSDSIGENNWSDNPFDHINE